MAVQKVATFTKPMTIDRRWEINPPSYLYHAVISFDIVGDVYCDLDDGSLDHLDCRVTNIKTNVDMGSETGYGFYDMLIICWKFAKSGTTRDAGHSEQPETLSNVLASVRTAFQKELYDDNNAIYGIWLDNQNKRWGKIDDFPSNPSKTFRFTNESELDDFVIINGIRRFRDNDAERIKYEIIEGDISFDPLHPYLDYYPFAIRKNGVWQSCNRFGVNNRTGADRINKGGYSTDINDVFDQKNLFNNFVNKNNLQSVFIKKNGSWKRSSIVGQNTGV